MMDSDSRPKDVVKALSSFVNCCSFKKETDEFVNAVMHEHRTLQQAIFALFSKLVVAWAEQEHFDLRNEHTVKTCKEILDKIPNVRYGAPLI